MALRTGRARLAAALLALACAAGGAAAQACRAQDEPCAADAAGAAADHVLLQHQRKVTVASPGADQTPPCLCVFDVDRTLTGKQGAKDQCTGDQEVPEIYDSAYGGGTLTLSALAAGGMKDTFCGQCYLGVCSAGDAGGDGSPERDFMAQMVLTSGPQEELAKRAPAAKAWSYGNRVTSPFVLSQPDRTKHEAVEKIVRWYRRHGIHIANEDVHFFGDRTENIGPFQQKGFNAREISCGSRDYGILNGMVGLCGARPEEIVGTKGVQTCDQAAGLPALDDSPGHDGAGKPLQKCQGDCDGDSDCEGALVCHQRDGFSAVPGCAGRGSWDFDYCVEAR